MTHTKGKWTLGNENNSCCDVVLGEEHNLVCTLDRQDANTSEVVISRDEMLANAHLIMAAPQLLEALKLASKLIGTVTIGQAIDAGIDLSELGMNPWCLNEGLATRDDEISASFLDVAIKAAEGGE